MLAAVKTEFGKFGGLLDRVNKKLQQAQKVLDVDLGHSRKAMVQRLRGVESLPEMEAVAVLGIDRPEDLLPEDAERASPSRWWGGGSASRKLGSLSSLSAVSGA